MNGNGKRPGDVLPGGNVLEDLYAERDEWQIFSTQLGSALLVSAGLHQTWLDLGLIEPGVFLPVTADIFAAEDESYGLISSSIAGPFPRNGQEAMDIASAFQRTRAMFGNVGLSQAFYLQKMPYLLPCGAGDDAEQDNYTLGRWLTGGINVPLTDRSRIMTYVPGMTDTLYQEMLALFGWTVTASERIQAMPAEPMAAAIHEKRRAKRSAGAFELPGRPELERFFREQIIDVIDREEIYQRMGVPFPGPTLLVGPPGCGKTYAVEKLTEYLGWPYFEVNSGTIASSYLHETSRLIAQLFENAMAEAPAVMIMDEMEAYLTTRSDGRGVNQHHMEEIAEFLRILPKLQAKKVLLFGMTNMPEQIDPAIRRKGRFDHVIEVGMPSRTEIMELLGTLLRDVPKDANLDPGRTADRLAMHPISDIAYVAREAGRLSVLCGKTQIDQEILDRACDELERERGNQSARRIIGFR